MGLPRFQGRGQRQAREAARLGLFDDGVPGSRFQPKRRAQLAVEQVEMVEGEPGKPAIRVLDDGGRPFLADAQHDLGVFGEPGPLRRGQRIGAGFARRRAFWPTASWRTAAKARGACSPISPEFRLTF